MSLGLASALLAVGALADDLGRRRVLAWSAGLLAFAGGLAAAAPDMAVLVAARVLQGVAGAGVLAASLAAIGNAFPDRRRPAPARPGSGQPRSAAASRSGRSQARPWRRARVAQRLLAAGGRRGGARPRGGGLARVARGASARPLDLPGVVTLGAGMACLTGGLVEGRCELVGGVDDRPARRRGAARGRLRAARARGPRPDARPGLFAEPRFVASIAGALFTGLAVIGLMSYSPIVYQRGLGLSVLASAGVSPSGRRRAWRSRWPRGGCRRASLARRGSRSG